MKLTRARAGKYLSNGAHTLSLFVTACFKHEHLTGLVLFSPLVRPEFPLEPAGCRAREIPRPIQ